MGKGYLTVQARAGGDALSVKDAKVTIKDNGKVLYTTRTNANGNTGYFSLWAPNKEYTLDPGYQQPAYSTCDVDVEAKGYITMHYKDVEITDTQNTILPVHMEPLEETATGTKDIDIVIPPVALLIPTENRQIDPPDMPRPRTVFNQVIIPDYITVHLGIPNNASARNVRVDFVEYIKNVVSSEIYSTWPYNALLANIHVIVTFALNRVYTEWYRNRGFNFDITNSTAYDQFYRDGGPIFENISKIVDSYFNTYVRRFGFINPFFTSFCNGTTATCAGLSQWGTVTLANQGRSPIEILRYYYPDDIELSISNNITEISETYPGYPLSAGSSGEAVRRMQNFLNRIRVNFPLIPQVTPDGVYGPQTVSAVQTFQRTFNLTVDGVIGRDTWNKISFIYVGVVKLAELDSEGERIGIGANPPNVVLQQGSRGEHVIELQFILNTAAQYYNTIPLVIKDGVFDAATKNAVIAFQKTFGLTQDGVVGPSTWNKLYSVYHGIQNNVSVPPNPAPPVTNAPPYPGTPLRIGSTGPNVRTMQTYLNTIRSVYYNIPPLTVDSVFGEETRRAVIAFQQEFVLTPDGVIGPVTWNKIVEMFLLVTGNTSASLQYPGVPLRLGAQGPSVRFMQQFLADLRAHYTSLPPVTVDGIFGPQTEAAVIGFQRLFGLVPDGIVGPITWYEIIRQRNAI